VEWLARTLVLRCSSRFHLPEPDGALFLRIGRWAARRTSGEPSPGCTADRRWPVPLPGGSAVRARC